MKAYLLHLNAGAQDLRRRATVYCYIPKWLWNTSSQQVLRCSMVYKSVSFCHQISLGDTGLDNAKLIYLFALDFLRSFNMLKYTATLLKREYSM